MPKLHRMKARIPSAHRGILLIIAAVFCLCGMDATVKFLSNEYSVLQLVWVRYFGQTLLVAVLFWQHLRMITQSKHPILQSLRSLSLFCASLFFFVGITKVDLVSATTILQTSPLIISVLAHFLLKERVGWQRVLGIVLGLTGTLVIIRPGTEVFSPYSLYALGGAIFYSTFAVLTRYLSKDENVWSSFLFTTLAGAVLSTLIVPFSWQTPALNDIPWFLLIAICAASGHWLFIKAHFLAEASALAPFTYVALIFATVNGFVFFADIPDSWTIIGASIVAGAGLFVWYRERRSRGQADNV